MRLVVYGLLAVCVALVLATRPGNEPDALALWGRTSKGLPLTLRFVDGELQSLVATASIYCPRQRHWDQIEWVLSDGSKGHFEQRGARFRVGERVEIGGGTRPPDISTFAIRGRLDDEAESARGTISAHWRSGRTRCAASVRFSAG